MLMNTFLTSLNFFINLVCIVLHCRTLETLLPICILCCRHIHFIEKSPPVESLNIGIKRCNFTRNVENGTVLITYILEIVCLIYCDVVYCTLCFKYILTIQLHYKYN